MVTDQHGGRHIEMCQPELKGGGGRNTFAAFLRLKQSSATWPDELEALRTLEAHNLPTKGVAILAVTAGASVEPSNALFVH